MPSYGDKGRLGFWWGARFGTRTHPSFLDLFSLIEGSRRCILTIVRSMVIGLTPKTPMGRVAERAEGVPVNASGLPAVVPRREGLRRVPVRDSMAEGVRVPRLPGSGGAVPVQESAHRVSVSAVRSQHIADGGYYPAQVADASPGVVLGGLPRHRADAWDVGPPIPSASSGSPATRPRSSCSTN